MEVHITEKDFNIVVKENGKKDIVLNANVEVFNYLNNCDKLLLGALDMLNSNNDNYFHNAIAYTNMFSKSYTTSFLIDDAKATIPNDLKGYTLENLPTSKEIENYSKKLLVLLKNAPITVYEIDDMSDVPLVCILHFARYGYAIKKCHNCGEWFIPKTTKDTIYCYRKDKEFPNKECYEAHKYKVLLQRGKNDEVFKLKKQVYNRFRDKAYKTTDDEKRKEAEEAFYQYRIEDAEKYTQYKENKITKDDYIKWLNSKKGTTKKTKK